jgi:hypothetical protein
LSRDHTGGGMNYQPIAGDGHRLGLLGVTG